MNDSLNFQKSYVKASWSSARAYILHARGSQFESRPCWHFKNYFLMYIFQSMHLSFTIASKYGSPKRPKYENNA